MSDSIELTAIKARVDHNPEKQLYDIAQWWGEQKPTTHAPGGNGTKIDYVLGNLKALMLTVGVTQRELGGSDHYPLTVYLNLEMIEQTAGRRKQATPLPEPLTESEIANPPPDISVMEEGELQSIIEWNRLQDAHHMRTALNVANPEKQRRNAIANLITNFGQRAEFLAMRQAGLTKIQYERTGWPMEITQVPIVARKTKDKGKGFDELHTQIRKYERCISGLTLVKTHVDNPHQPEQWRTTKQNIKKYCNKTELTTAQTRILNKKEAPLVPEIEALQIAVQKLKDQMSRRLRSMGLKEWREWMRIETNCWKWIVPGERYNPSVPIIEITLPDGTKKLTANFSEISAAFSGYWNGNLNHTIEMLNFSSVLYSFVEVT